ncbi:dephospho-CoA kinase [Legionella norrlandica]|uniref:Dephospho-CoA kinase n=1 Tax=Legionella norrlandica TaxID=1498499 RepID=A0A0A2SYD2_9GAMM|nr:dephospho-CoA kinase [Legionella norrlandica]KGP64404.1 dephospho-CoA kinase [Legionella norrlandica]
MVYSVGLTGNIASGKSTVAEFFSELGINIINADKISKELTSVNTPCYKDIISHFGSSIVLENGNLDRKRLRDIIFSEPKQRLWLENLLHPAIRKKIEEQISTCSSPYCLIEIPLLFDKKNYPYLRKILLVSAPLEIQLERIIRRDHCTKAQALAILTTQPNLEQRMEIADDVLINDAGLNELREKVNKLHKKYLKEAKMAHEK